MIWQSFTICATILLWLPAGTHQVRMCSMNQLEATIVSVNNYKLTVTIKNKGSEGACILKWNTMMDGEYWPSAVSLFEGDDIKKYAKPVIPLRQDIKGCDYEFIGKSKSITFKRDLTEVFSFTARVDYFLQVETKSNDCFKASRSSDCAPRAANNMKPLKYSCPDLATQEYYFTASTDKAAVPETFSEWLIKNPPTKKNNDNSIVAFGTSPYITEEKFNKVISDQKEASRYLKLASDYLNPYDATHIPLYEQWFGKYSKANYDIVSNNFEETFDGTKEPHVYNFLPDILCPPDFLAHVDSGLSGKKQHVINICPLLLTKSKQEQVITIVHEMTHDSSATDDETLNNGDKCYSPDTCKKLVKEKPQTVIYNAENYALFASALANPSKKRKRVIPKSKKSKVIKKAPPKSPQATKKRRKNQPIFKLIQLFMLLATE